MLVLTRKQKQTIKIGDEIEITVISFKCGGVRIGIDAPDSYRILRGELDCHGNTEEQATSPQGKESGLSRFLPMRAPSQ